MEGMARIPPDEFAERRRRAARAATSAGYDGLIVVGRSSGTLDSMANIYWLTHHYFVPPVVTPTGPWRSYGHDVLVIDGDARAVLCAVGTTEELFVDDVRLDLDVEELVVQAIRALNLERSNLGLVGSDVLPWSLTLRLQKEFPRLVFTPADLMLAELRLTLSRHECVMLRQAARIGCSVLRAALEAAVVGATDGHVTGAGWLAAARVPRTQHWNFILASGKNALKYAPSGLPSWDSESQYRAGDMIHPDCYGYVDGYMYDIQRTAVVGAKPSRKQQCLIDRSWEHAQTLGALLRNGVTPREIYDTGVGFRKKHGYDHALAPAWDAHGHFGHGFASGFDWPWLGITAPGADQPLTAPFAVTIELWWGEAGIGAAWVEDNYLVLPDGVENLTDLPKTLEF